MLTYNNGVVVRGRGQPVVYLPQYGWEAMDGAGRAAWTRIGFRVVQIPGYAGSARLGGALRCTLKVLERLPWPPPQRAVDA